MVTDDNRLRVADDRDGLHLWPTTAERAEAERERAEAERERADARARALEAELATMRDELLRLRSGG